jgi:DsbC/DsbD-like thiol-disulfide interchange protein
MRGFSFQCAVFSMAAMLWGEQLPVAKPLDIRLVAEPTSIQAGKPFYVGLHLVHKKDYHTYWKFPGIVGVATHMEWNLPEGWQADPIEWPEPERVFMFKIKAQGYRGEMMLPIKITPPDNLAADTKITLQGKATWMCCAKECNPGFAELSLDLPVTETAQPQGRYSALFAKAHATQPAKLKGWSAGAVRQDNVVLLTMKPQSEAALAQASKIKEALFFTDDGFIHSDADQPMHRAADGSVILELPISQYAPKPEPKVLRGVVKSSSGWLPDQSTQSAIIAVDLE